MRHHRSRLAALALPLLLAPVFAFACGGDDGGAPTDTLTADTALAIDTEAPTDTGGTGPADTLTGDDADATSPGDGTTPADAADTGSPGDTAAPVDTHVPGLTTAARAPSFTDAMVSGSEVLGPRVVDGGTSFTVYSEHATRIEVLLWGDADVEMPDHRVPLTRFGNVWSAWVEGVGYGQRYGYVAWGPNWPYDPKFTPGSDIGYVADVDADGNRYNPNKLLLDPYALGVDRDFDWARSIPATGHGRKRATWWAAGKSVVTKSDYQWSANEAAWQARRADPDAPGNGWHEQIAYEVHVRGFTRIPSSGTPHHGTFLALGEKADYLVDLGVTAVELMPVTEKPVDGGYWGYQPLSYFAPELTYCTATTPEGRLDEVKQMVDTLHQQGLEVWIDVVYNHTGEGGLWSQRPTGFEAKDTVSLYSYRGLDNRAYYALTADNQGYWPNTGVGNQTRTNAGPFKKLILDSLRFWVTEMHVDGFRFDLAPVLGAKDGDYDRWIGSDESVLREILEDPVLRAHNTRVIAEPWATGGDYAFALGRFPASATEPGIGWYEWNANFRDWWRGFVNFDDHTLSGKEGAVDGGGTLTGSYDIFHGSARRPYHSVNFVTIHDGMTMYDVVSYDQKQNDCSPLVPICCSEPDSPWCDPSGGENNNRSRDWGADEAQKRALMRNFYVAMALSHGTPLLLGGDEWLRTQLGNNNAWTDSADTAANWFQWGAWKLEDERLRMVDFVSKLNRFRRARVNKLAPKDYGSGSPFEWHDESGAGEPSWGSRHLMIRYTGADGSREMLVLLNMERHDVGFTLPSGSWARLVDTQKWFDDAPYFAASGAATDVSANITLDDPVIVDTSYVVKDSSIVVLERPAP
ncbi:MAG: glycosyl hydrolase [Myxococcales bacterium]|nr:glycosyl hydrolase [Myxococcales bacterium]